MCAQLDWRQLDADYRPDSGRGSTLFRRGIRSARARVLILSRQAGKNRRKESKLYRYVHPTRAIITAPACYLREARLYVCTHARVYVRMYTRVRNIRTAARANHTPGKPANPFFPTIT